MPEDDDRPRRARRRFVTGGRVVAALACLFGGTIIVNAVMMQNEKHPTPLFRNAIREAESFPAPPLRPEPATRQAAHSQPAHSQPATPTARPVPAPAAPVAAKPAEPPPAAAPSDPLLADIQRELTRRGFYKGEAHGRPGTATTQAIRDYQFSQRVPVDGRPSEALLKDLQSASRAAMRDELSDLLKRNGTERPAAEDKPSRTVLDVQRALNKAGYGPLTEDGQMGPSTRNALAKFEGDRKLPPRGEPKGPVLKLLASTTGIAITNP
ncbi:MAG: peptidoglycan-binding domain-containing protein [Beijerinckiaceae bacterium]|nr:peptidoglycan-binding domain-containing protein [Beijerinckiaceae bacterium]MCZ8298671.1 peptidoglycan-binding domain-containing protein [Beijerinckiaceae bacterium]